MCTNDTEEGAKSSHVLFVSNLPFSTNDQALEQAFEEFGPLKRCFVVKDSESAKCRGFGYVTFVLIDDAEKAVASSVSIGKRQLRIEFANKRESKTKREVPDLNKQKNEKPAKKKTKVNVAKRTVVITGLKGTTNKDEIRTVCEKYGKVEQVEYVNAEGSPVAVHVHYVDFKDAVRAFQKMNGTQICGEQIFAHLLSQEKTVVSRKKLKQNRLIIRNLSFDCSVEELSSILGQVGPINDIHLPTREKQGKVKKLGFCFVEYKSKAVAEQAIKTMNGCQIHGRPIIIDWAVSRDEYAKKGVSQDAVNKDDVKDDKIKNKESRIESTQNSDDADDSSVSVQESEPEYMDNVKDVDASENEEESEEAIDSEVDDPVVKKAGGLKYKENYSPPTDAEEGRTIFVRNLPFNCDEEEFFDVFNEFGDILYAKIVIDQETGHSRGTGFVKFKTAESAAKCINNINTRKEENNALNMHGRELSVVMAVTRKEVEKVSKSTPEKKDKRNLYLAAEGILLKNMVEKKALDPKDLQRREKAWAEKKAKLKNINTFVSKTRLCFRNLPASVDEKSLKMAIRNASQIPAWKIKQCKIMRSKTQVQKDGDGKSLCFGFVEFAEHEDAKKILQIFNNNDQVFGTQRKPIVDFAVENQLILRMRKDRIDRFKRKTEQRLYRVEGSASSKGETKKERLVSRSKFKEEGESKHHVGTPNEKGKTDKYSGKRKKGKQHTETKTPPITQDLEELGNKGKTKNPKSQQSKRPVEKTMPTQHAMIAAHKDNDIAVATRKKIPKTKAKGGVKRKGNDEEQKFRLMVTKYRKLFDTEPLAKKTGRWFEES